MYALKRNVICECLAVSLIIFTVGITADLCPPPASLAPSCTCLTLAEGVGISCRAVRDVGDLLGAFRLVNGPISEISISDSPQMKNFALESLEEVPNLKDMQSLMLYRVIINIAASPKPLNYPKLRSLNISKNGIRDIPPPLLSNLTELTYLNLSHNALTTIFPGHFDALKKLENLGNTRCGPQNSLGYGFWRSPLEGRC